MSKIIDILNLKGEKVGDFEIADTALEQEKGAQAVHDVVVAFNNECRAGTASTKTRAEVSGGGKKPMRQKGLGGARAGSTRNPVWRHGGVAFGPKPRDYSQKVNAKVKKLALKRVFSDLLLAGNVIVVDDLKFESKKTKDAVNVFKAIKAEGKLLCMVNDFSIDEKYSTILSGGWIVDNVQLAMRNLPNADVIRANFANTYMLIWADKLVFSKAALEDFIKRIS